MLLILYICFMNKKIDGIHFGKTTILFFTLYLNFICFDLFSQKVELTDDSLMTKVKKVSVIYEVKVINDSNLKYFDNYTFYEKFLNGFARDERSFNKSYSSNYDNNGNLIYSEGEYFHIKRIYNNSNLLLQENKYSNSTKRIVKSIIYTYEKSNIISKTTYIHSNDNSKLVQTKYKFSVEKFEYDKKKLVKTTESQFSMNDTSVCSSESYKYYEYFDNNILKKITQRNKNNIQKEMVVYDFVKDVSANSKPINIGDSLTLMERGQRVFNLQLIKKFKYDFNLSNTINQLSKLLGTTFKLSIIDEQGKLFRKVFIVNNKLIFSTKYTYDYKKNVTSCKLFNENEELILEYKINYEY